WSLEITSGEMATTTDAGGDFRFAGLDNGEYYVRAQVPLGWTQTLPVADYIYANMLGNTLVNNAYFGLAENMPPVLDPIGDQTMSHTQDTLDVTLTASDADGDTLSLSAEAFSADELAYQLDQELGLYSARDDYYFNHRGYGEKYIRAADSTWYYMFSGGELYRWGGSIQDSTLLTTLGSQYHADPSLLVDAQAPVASISDQVTIGLSGNTLTIDPADGYTGAFFIRASVSDGVSTTSEIFTVSVTNGVTGLQQVDNGVTDAVLSPAAEDVGLANKIEDDAFWSASTPETRVLDEVYSMLEELKELHSLRLLI
ncbi:MAG: hypothetical protein V3V75_11195, partial [Thermoguttaceae bacterium]